MSRRRIKGVPQTGLSSGRLSQQHFLLGSGAGWARSGRCGTSMKQGKPQNTVFTPTSTHLAFGQASFLVVLHEGLVALNLQEGGQVLEGLFALTDQHEQQHCKHARETRDVIPVG